MSIEKKQKFFTVRSMCVMGVLSALAAVVMYFEIPLWFAPGFYKIDLSEVIVLIGALALGPVEGIIIEFLKVAINSIFTGSTTMYVGEAANFIIGCSFIVPASVIYRKIRNRKGAVIALCTGTLSITIAGSLLNYFVLLPAYSMFYGVPISAFVGQGTEKNSSINNLITFIIFATVPFNLLKGIISSVITFIIYKKIKPIIHK